jgi:glycolate oxidase FAD binding subunit
MGLKTQRRIPGKQISVEDQRRFGVDGLLPSKAMYPASPEEAAQSLQVCAEAGVTAVIHGGGTQIGLGNPPRSYDVAVSTARLDQLLEYEPADLTCRVQAGMRIQVLQETLAKKGQRLPLDPPLPGRATLGGILAANTNGLNAGRYGTVRDWVVGIAVAYPTGKVARAGGKVVKNVAGYDLMKLHIGALGTLGLIAEVNLKVQTLPEAAATLLAHFENVSDALEAARQLARSYLAPASLALLDRKTLWECGVTADWHWTLAVGLEGYAREVKAAQTQTSGVIRSAGGRIDALEAPPGFWERTRDWPAAETDQVGLHGMSSLTGLASMVRAAGPEARLLAHPAAGEVHLRVPIGTAELMLWRLRQATGEEGRVIVRSAPAEMKVALNVWGPPPPGFPLMQGLKRALDPKTTLNPGRFVGGI